MIEIAPAFTEVELPWNEALMYCQFIEVDGKRDWRLPTWKEFYNHVRITSTITGNVRYWVIDDEKLQTTELHAPCVNSFNHEPYYSKKITPRFVRAVRDDFSVLGYHNTILNRPEIQNGKII